MPTRLMTHTEHIAAATAATAAADTLDALAPYLRVSTAEQRANKTIETQRGLLERWLHGQGVAPVGWYQDDGVSGTIAFADRPDGKRLLADIEAGRVRFVLVSKLDRFGRNAREILNAVHTIESAGARLLSLKENIDTRTTAGRFFLTVLAGVAELERDMILQRTQDGTANRLLETTWMGGRAPYGYQVKGKKDKARLVIQKREAEVVGLMWRLLVEEDLSAAAIAARLTQAGIPTRTNCAAGWSPAVVTRILGDASYAGVRTYRAADGTRHSASIKPIFTRSQVAQARAALNSHRRYSAQRAAGTLPYLLRGLVVCAECGQPYTTSWRGVTTRAHGWGKWRYYGCSTRLFRTQHARRQQVSAGAAPALCHGVSVNADALERAVWADVFWLVTHPDETVKRLIAQQQEQGAAQDETRAALAEAQADVDALQAQRDRMVHAYRTGLVSETDLAHQLAEIAGDEQRLARRREKLTATLREHAAAEAQLDAVWQALTRWHGLLASEPLTDDVKRELVAALVKRVDVSTLPDGISQRGRQKYRALALVTYAFADPHADAADADVVDVSVDTSEASAPTTDQCRHCQ